MKKILIIIPNFESGGAERVHVNLANEWSRNFDVSFAVMSKQGSLLNILDKKIRIYDLEIKKIKHFIIPLIKIYKFYKPDIIISAMWPLTSVSLIAKFLSFKKNNIYFVEHCKLSGDYLNEIKSNNILTKIILSITYRFAKKIICVSECVQQDMIELTNLSKDKFKVIYNPVYLNMDMTFKIDNYIKYFNGYKYKLLGVGTLKKQKDFKTLIKSFALLIKNIEASLVIVGDGPEKKNLEKLILDLNLGKRVKLFGFDDNLYPWFKVADLYVHSAIYDGMPLTILESLLCGTPVVSTRSKCGPEEILDYGKYGDLVKIADFKELAMVIEKRLLTKNNKNKLKKRASEFSLQKISNQYLNLFNL